MAYTLPAGNAASFLVRAETYPAAFDKLDFYLPAGAYTPPSGGNMRLVFPQVDWILPLGNAANFHDGRLTPILRVNVRTGGTWGASRTRMRSVSSAIKPTARTDHKANGKWPAARTVLSGSACAWRHTTTLDPSKKSVWSAAGTPTDVNKNTYWPRTAKVDDTSSSPWDFYGALLSVEQGSRWRNSKTADVLKRALWGGRLIPAKVPIEQPRASANAANFSVIGGGITAFVPDTTQSGGVIAGASVMVSGYALKVRGAVTTVAEDEPNTTGVITLSGNALTVQGDSATIADSSTKTLGSLSLHGVVLSVNGFAITVGTDQVGAHTPVGNAIACNFTTDAYRLPYMTSRAVDYLRLLGNAANFDYLPTYIDWIDEYGNPVLRGAETQTVSRVPWGLSKTNDNGQTAPWTKFSRPLNPGWGVITPPGGVETPAGETTTIPVQRVYIVLNEIQILRVSDLTPITASALSVSFDCDSWLPQFSATIPESARSAIMPDPSPVEIAVYINDTEFRFFVERINRNRQFGSNTVAISGRGIACELDAPYATASQHTNSATMTAQQIIDAALTNTDYTQSWNITDWSVPANTFSLFGTPAEVAANVADASGSVLQAGRYSRTLRMLPRYPLKPWEWANNTAFSAAGPIIIPSSVAQAESIEWVEKPAYNVVYVSGVQNGVLGQVKITGTAGDLPAPMVTNPLITHVDAARQKGIAILSDTGRKAMMQITMPVLPTSGVIDVCRMVEFNDGSTARRGIVRANNVSVNWPTVRQTLTIEAAV